MTEEEWLHGLDPNHYPICYALIPSTRALWLLAVLCCRRVEHQLVDPEHRQLINLGERYAEGAVSSEELTEALASACYSTEELRIVQGRQLWSASVAAAYATLAIDPRVRGLTVVENVANHMEHAIELERGRPLQTWWMYAAMHHEVFGGREQPNAGRPRWSAAVMQLAEAMYAGEKCAFALRDALLETGRTVLADHFIGPIHPKGCWALDQILGRS